jgi:hypothetical protein
VGFLDKDDARRTSDEKLRFRYFTIWKTFEDFHFTNTGGDTDAERRTRATEWLDEIASLLRDYKVERFGKHGKYFG